MGPSPMKPEGGSSRWRRMRPGRGEVSAERGSLSRPDQRTLRKERFHRSHTRPATMPYADIRLVLLALSVAILWMAETAAPHFADYLRDRRARVRHGARNATLAALNGILGVLILATIIGTAVVVGDAYDFGLLRLVSLPLWLECLLALLLFDAWMYWWHRLNHEIPFLWQFHKVHHSDNRMDVSTALRFHPGEIVLSTLARVPVLVLLGMELWQLALYELIAVPVVAFHHSNISIPRRWDDRLRWFMVTPWMHWVHHSRRMRETNSNYSSVLSVWDRIFRSYRFRPDPDRIRFGLSRRMDRQSKQKLTGMLRTPFE